MRLQRAVLRQFGDEQLDEVEYLIRHRDDELVMEIITGLID